MTKCGVRRGEGGETAFFLFLPLFLSNVYHTIPIQLRRKRGTESAEFGVISSSVRHSSSRFPFISARSLARSLLSPLSRGSEAMKKDVFAQKRKREGEATISCSLSMFSSLMRLSGLVSVTRVRVEPAASDSIEVPKIPRGSLLLS